MTPTLGEQQEFWNSWNKECRFTHTLTPLNERQLDVALGAARRLGTARARILEIGCGTGWLAARLRGFGDVTGMDLSPEAIAWGKQEFPGLELKCAGFVEAREITGPYDLVISSEVIAHVPDQQAFVDRIAGVTAPGGLFLLITQNGYVWRHTSHLRPQGKGQIRDWPSIARVRELLSKDFTLERVGSINPSGDRGILRVVKLTANRHVARIAPGFHRTWSGMLEAMLAGSDLVFWARRRA